MHTQICGAEWEPSLCYAVRGEVLEAHALTGMMVL